MSEETETSDNEDGSISESIRLELGDRYQKTIDIQVTSIQNFDNKTWRTIRATGIIAGAGIGGFSLIASQPDATPLAYYPVQIVLSIASILFMLSFALGIRSYQSSQIKTPPWVEIGTEIHKSNTRLSDYENAVLKSYTDAIDTNNTTLRKKQQRFRHTLLMLLLGVCNIGICIVLLIWIPEISKAYGFILAGEVLGIVLSMLVLYAEDFGA